MANQTMRYETILIFNVALGEEAVSALVEKFKTLIAENATVEKIEEWGKRRLAYPIEDENEGYYVLWHFECKPDFPAELNRVLEITEGVLRSLIVRNEVELQPAKPAAEPVSEAPAPAPEEVPAPAEEAPAAPVPKETEAPVEEASAEPTAPVQEETTESADAQAEPAEQEQE